MGTAVPLLHPPREAAAHSALDMAHFQGPVTPGEVRGCAPLCLASHLWHGSGSVTAPTLAPLHSQKGRGHELTPKS